MCQNEAAGAHWSSCEKNVKPDFESGKPSLSARGVRRPFQSRACAYLSFGPHFYDFLSAMDITPFIEAHTSELLNADGTLDDVFLRRPDDPEFKDPKGISSDCDPQLLFTLQFKETIKLAAIKFICPSAGMKHFFPGQAR